MLAGCLIDRRSPTSRCSRIGEETVTGYDAIAAGDKAKASGAAFEKQINIAFHDAGYPLVRGAAKVPESKLDGFVAANPELTLDAAAVRGGDKASMTGEQLVAAKLLTAEEAAGVTEMPVYTIDKGGAFCHGRRSGPCQLDHASSPCSPCSSST
jgi:hypothetical protein